MIRIGLIDERDLRLEDAKTAHAEFLRTTGGKRILAQHREMAAAKRELTRFPLPLRVFR